MQKHKTCIFFVLKSRLDVLVHTGRYNFIECLYLYVYGAVKRVSSMFLFIFLYALRTQTRQTTIKKNTTIPTITIYTT